MTGNNSGGSAMDRISLTEFERFAMFGVSGYGNIFFFTKTCRVIVRGDCGNEFESAES